MFDIYEFLGEGAGPDPSIDVTVPAGTNYYTEPTVVTASALNCDGTNWTWSHNGVAAGCTGTVLTGYRYSQHLSGELSPSHWLFRGVLPRPEPHRHRSEVL